MKCPRCKHAMTLYKKSDLEQYKNVPNRKQLLGLTKQWKVEYMYHCALCGQLAIHGEKGDFFLPKILQPRKEELNIELRAENDKTPADINELLKLKPGKTVLSTVMQDVGQPFAVHKLETGMLLCFHSADPHNPHSVLIDPMYQVVKLVAIHNDHEAFDLVNLGTAYGQQEFVTRMDGSEYWMYEAYGVAKVTEGFNDEAILYVQFFENRLDMNRYMEMNCFSEETFMCDASDPGWQQQIF